MSFTLFPQLPGEMRDSIWLAAIQPRIVTIRKVESELFLHVRSTTPIPPALHVCKDSRNLMVNAGYKLTFGPANPPNDTDSDAVSFLSCRPFIFSMIVGSRDRVQRCVDNCSIL